MSKSEITSYFHCKGCNSGQLAVGQTKDGIQVYCEDCEMSVIKYEDEEEIEEEPKKQGSMFEPSSTSMFESSGFFG